VTEDWLRRAYRPVRITRIDATAPNVARVWNYMTGGRDNFEADRAAARALIAASPVMADVAQASRAFLRRVVRFLAAEAGIRQFLDIGTGIPAAGSTRTPARCRSPARKASSAASTRTPASPTGSSPPPGAPSTSASRPPS
jgi:S-adenosyl methyltransferase